MPPPLSFSCFGFFFLFPPAIMKCCYASIILLWGGTGSCTSPDWFRLRELALGVWTVERAAITALQVRRILHLALGVSQILHHLWLWHVTLRPFWQSLPKTVTTSSPAMQNPHNKMYIFFVICFFFLFPFCFFVVALPLPLSLVWNSHRYTMEAASLGCTFVGVAMI